MRIRQTIILFLFLFFISPLFSQGETCDDAIQVPYVSSWCDTLTNLNFSADNSLVDFNPIGINCPTPERDIWFAFTPSTSPTQPDLFGVEITVTGFDNGTDPAMTMPQISFVRGLCNVALEASACAQAGIGENSVSLTIPAGDLFEGLTYYIIISDWTNTGTSNDGMFEFCFEEFVPPTEFNISDGAVYTECSGTLYDSGGPDNDYSPDENISAQICPTDPFSCLVVNVVTYEIGGGSDVLDITTNSPTGSGACLGFNGGGSFSGTGSSITTLYFDDCVDLDFNSNATGESFGFELTWSCDINQCEVEEIEYPPSEPGGAWEVTGCGAGAGSDPAIFYPDPPPGEVTFNVLSTCWGGTGVEAFFYYWFEAEVDGVFEFTIANPPPAAGNNIDVDYLVWGPLPGPDEFCNTTELDAPIRCSWAAGGIDDLTGLANIHPVSGIQVTDTSEGAGGDGFTSGINVLEGEYYLVLLNYFSGESLQDGISIDFSGSTSGMFGDDASALTSSVADTSICLGQAVPIEIQGADISISWSPASGLSCSDCPNPVAAPVTTTTYTVIGEGICGTDTLSITIDVFDLSDIPDESICDGESVQLQANSNNTSATWSWTPATGLSCTDCPNPIATPTVTTTYTVTMVTPECTLTEDVTVTVQSGAAANYVIAADTTICAGSSVTLGGAADPDATYSWDPITDLDLTDPANPIATPSVTTTYTLEVTNNISGCISTDQVTITVVDSFTPTILGSLEICTNTTLSTEIAYDSYEWLPSGDTTAQLVVNTPGDYTLIVSDANGCTGSNTVTVTSGASPVPSIIHVGDATCANPSNGTIVIGVTGGSYPYSYTWTNNVSTDSVALNLEAGIYTVTIMDGGGCASEISAEVLGLDPIVLQVDKDTICPGELIQLSATGGMGTGSYIWSPSVGLNLSDNANPTANPLVTTTYVVSNVNLLGNIITNGDFESGNVGFNSDYSLGDGGTWGDLSDEGEYGIYTSPVQGHSNFVDCPDHTSGNGNMLVVNGATLAGQSVWCQTVPVDPGVDYNLSTWLMSVVSDNPASLQFSINGSLLGSELNLTSTTCDWTQFSTTWNSNTQTSAELCIVNLNTSGGGNDFALDDIEFGPICSLSDSVTVYVSNTTANIIDVNEDFCGSCAGSITVEASGGFDPYTYEWNNSQMTETAIDLCGNQVYDVTVTDSYGCSAVSAQLLNELTFIPVEIEGNAVICEEGSTTLTAGPTLYNTYEWSNNGEDTPSIDVSLGGTYTVTVTTVGCSGTAEIEVTENANPVPTISGATLGCEGDTILLEAETGYDVYFWGNGILIPTLEVTTSGTYTVTVTDTNGCMGENSIDVLFEDLYLDVTADMNLCLGETTTLTANTLGAVYWYEESSSTPINSTAGAALDITPTAAGSYSYVAEAISNACTLYDTIMIEVSEPPTITTSDVTFCFGNDVTISATSDIGTILWTPEIDFTDPTANTQTISPNASATYVVEATNGNCKVTEEVDVILNEGPEYGVIDDQVTCPDAPPITIGTVTASGTTYQWTSNGAPVDNADIGTPDVSPDVTTTYTLTASNGLCTEVDSVTISVVDPTVTVNDTIVCEGEVVTLTAVGSEAGGTYTWLDYEGNAVHEGPVFSVTASGSTSYLVSYEFGGCTATAVAEITVNPRPNITLSANPGTEVVSGTEVIITASGADSYDWQIFGGENLPDTDADIVVAPQVTTTYIATGTSAEGCPSESTGITINVTYIELEVPNIFTPNHDELNDEFFPIYNDLSVDILEFKVFDRWGELVHDSVNTPWNGEYDGKAVPADIYIWFVKARYADGREETRKGDVALVR